MNGRYIACKLNVYTSNIQKIHKGYTKYTQAMDFRIMSLTWIIEKSRGRLKKIEVHMILTECKKNIGAEICLLRFLIL